MSDRLKDPQKQQEPYPTDYFYPRCGCCSGCGQHRSYEYIRRYERQKRYDRKHRVKDNNNFLLIRKKIQFTASIAVLDQ